MNCVNCFHYAACQGVDVTGYVTDREKTSEEACEHFVTHNDVHPSAHWERKVENFSRTGSDKVFVSYQCSHCHAEARGTLKSFHINDWNNYWADHYMPEKFYAYCNVCGAKMNLEETDHTNWVTIH